MRTAGVLTVVLLVTAPGPTSQPALDELLRVSREYVAAYGPKVSGTLLDERYTLNEVSTGRIGVPNRIASDLILLYVNGHAMSLRDSYSVNGAKLRSAEPRLPALLAQPTVAAWDQARAYDASSQRHFLGEIVVRVNDPVLALRFLSLPPERVTFTLDGRRKLNGVDSLGLRFAEKTGDGLKYALGTRGNAFVSGRYWVEPSTGVIRQTELFVESKTETARVITTYAHAAALDTWLPSKTTEYYEQREIGGGPSQMGRAGGYGASQKFEGNAAYANPRHTPVDLTRISR